MEWVLLRGIAGESVSGTAVVEAKRPAEALLCWATRVLAVRWQTAMDGTGCGTCAYFFPSLRTGAARHRNADLEGLRPDMELHCCAGPASGGAAGVGAGAKAGAEASAGGGSGGRGGGPAARGCWRRRQEGQEAALRQPRVPDVSLAAAGSCIRWQKAVAHHAACRCMTRQAPVLGGVVAARGCVGCPRLCWVVPGSA